MAFVKGAHYFEDSDINLVAVADLVADWIRARGSEGSDHAAVLEVRQVGGGEAKPLAIDLGIVRTHRL